MRLLIANLVIGLVLLLAATLAYGQDRNEALFRAGIQAMEDGAHLPEGPREEKFDEAIAAFRSILVDRPELVRVRLELARAFFLKGEDTLARRHFEQVLAGDVPQGVAANVARFLRIMRARRRWEAHFGAAIAPDSNLNAASGARTIYLDFLGQRLPFTRQGDIAPESGLGLSLWGGGEHQYPLSQTLRLRSGANASIRDYKGRAFDRQSLSAHLGPRRLLGARTEASLLATVDRQWTAGMPETDRFGLRLEGRHRLTPRLALNARASAARRNCRDCNHIDGPVADASLAASWVALPILRVGGHAGWSRERARAEHQRTRGHRAGLNASLALPAGFTLGLGATVQRTKYGGRGAGHLTIDRKQRRDETHTLSVSVHNRAVTVLGFSPRLSLVREERDTNAQTLDYKRNRAELSFVRQF